MYRRILVPLDGSDTAEIVLPYAEEIAARFAAEVTLVTVSEAVPANVDRFYRSYLERVKEQVQRQLKDWGGREGWGVKIKILPGKPAFEILRYADEINTSLIVMASRGASSQGPWLLGNIAAKVLRATSHPVLLVRTPVSEVARQRKAIVKRILLPLDGSRAGETTIPQTEALAQALDAELVMYQALTISWVGGSGVADAVVQDEDRRKAAAVAYLNSVAKPLRDRGLTVTSAVDWGAPADEIISYAEANNIDLIAMSTHGRSGIGRWVFGSVTDKVIHAGKTPVLIVPV
ncbi:MAG: universal stress protein, partial [Dehalococcoidales bacterium]|nr:universal stress protein [Dehalococcoidales bacterium]